MTRRVSKFGGGVSTPPLAARVALTAGTLALGAMLVVRIIRETSGSNLGLAGFVLFLLGVWFLGSVVFLPHLWRASDEWKRQQYQAHRLERRLRIALEPSRRPNLALARARTAYCPVCGQHGPALARSRTVCSACQRPWAAGTAMPAPMADASRPPSVIDLRDRVATHR